jgi:hypothetical protein
VCAWPDCDVSLKGTRHNRRFCDEHAEDAHRAAARASGARSRQEAQDQAEQEGAGVAALQAYRERQAARAGAPGRPDPIAESAENAA